MFDFSCATFLHIYNLHLNTIKSREYVYLQYKRMAKGNIGIVHVGAIYVLIGTIHYATPSASIIKL